jgi:protoporphyrinogen oxidase
MATRKTIAILGGGPCGLYAAWELAGSGAEVVVLEADSTPGGLCRTNERQGYRFDLGGHRFISRDQGLVDKVTRLMGAELLVSERKSSIRFMGKSLKYPLDPFDLVLKMNPLLSLSCLTSYAASRLRHRVSPGREDTLEEWLVNRYGRRLYEIFFEPYSTKLWGIGPDKMSSDWAAQRISLINLTDVILRLFRLKGGTPRTYAIKYFYPKRGIGQMFDMISSELKRQGVDIRFGARVNAIRRRAGGGFVVEYKRLGKVESLECDFVISTLLLAELPAMLEPAPPKEVLDAARGLRFRSLRFMHIMLEGIEDLSPFTWWYVQDGKYIATRLQEPTRRSPFSAPPGKTSVMLEIPCSEGDTTWNMSDADLFSRCAADLKGLGVDIAGKTVGYFTTRALHSYPVYTMDYRSNRDKVIDYVRTIPDFVSTGRQGLFDYIFMDDAMLMGAAASKVALGVGSAKAIYDRAQSRDLLEIKSVVTDDKGG